MPCGAGRDQLGTHKGTFYQRRNLPSQQPRIRPMARAHLFPIPVEGDCLVVAEVADFRTLLPAIVHGGCVLERATDAATPFLSDLIGALLFWNANPFEVELDPNTKKPTPLPGTETETQLVLVRWNGTFFTRPAASSLQRMRDVEERRLTYLVMLDKGPPDNRTILNQQSLEFVVRPSRLHCAGETPAPQIILGHPQVIDRHILAV